MTYLSRALECGIDLKLNCLKVPDVCLCSIFENNNVCCANCAKCWNRNWHGEQLRNE